MNIEKMIKGLSVLAHIAVIVVVLAVGTKYLMGGNKTAIEPESKPTTVTVENDLSVTVTNIVEKTVKFKLNGDIYEVPGVSVTSSKVGPDNHDLIEIKGASHAPDFQWKSPYPGNTNYMVRFPVTETGFLIAGFINDGVETPPVLPVEPGHEMVQVTDRDTAGRWYKDAARGTLWGIVESSPE